MRSDGTGPLRLCLVAAALLVGGGCLDAIPPDALVSGPRGGVSGVVNDQCQRTPLSGATVVAGSQVVTTGDQGRFAIEGLEPGAAQLIVTASGYLDARPQVVIMRGQTVELEITLSPVPSSKPLPQGLDVLFVVDNSGSMAEEQLALSKLFPEFLDALVSTFDSIRVGVTSTDLGAGGYGLPSCERSGGDGGALLNSSCVASGSHIAIERGTATNVAGGDARAAFSCMVQLGIGGCGFEQPLEAVWRALQPDGPNAGFVREEAMLAVVVVSDEDDCSPQQSPLDVSLFDPAADALGPLTSFRCFEHGVTCDVDGREPGPRRDCRPSPGGKLQDIQRYVDLLHNIKRGSAGEPLPERVFFAVVAGPSEPVEVGQDGANPVLRASCQSPNGIAVPAIRLKAVVDALNTNLSPRPFFSICDARIPLRALALQLVTAASFRSCD